MKWNHWFAISLSLLFLCVVLGSAIWFVGFKRADTPNMVVSNPETRSLSFLLYFGSMSSLVASLITFAWAMTVQDFPERNGDC